MHRPSSTWQVKRPLFVSGLIAVAVTAIALKASLAVTMGCVVPLIVLLLWKRLRLCAIIALCFLLVAVGYRHTYALPAERLTGQSDTIEGQVLEMPTNGRMYLVKVTRSTYLPKGSRVMLRCPDEQSPYVGDTFVAQVELLSLKENQISYASNRAFACAFPEDGEDSLRITRSAEQQVGVLERARTALVSVVRRALPPRESGILSALCFGEKTLVAAQDSAAFQGSGLSHLLVVSGLHLSILALTIRRLLRRLGKYPCLILTLCSIWLFALFVGASPSILRAATMLSLWLVGCLLFQQGDGLNALGLAAILLLAIHPYTLWDVGFQLSFAATLGVLVLARRLMPQRKADDADLPWYRRLWKWIRNTLTATAVVCVSATLFSLPVACYRFGGFPLTSLPANLLAGPVAATTMLLGWAGAIVGIIPYMGWLSNGILAVAGLLAKYMQKIAHLLSSDRGWVTVSQRWMWLLLLSVCALIVGAILCRIPRKRVGVTLLTLVLLTTAVGVPFLSAPVRLTVVPEDNQGGFILQQGDHCALIVTAAREIDEVVYDTPAFSPDVLIALGGDASATSLLNRWPQATVIVATPTDWVYGATRPLTALPVGGAVELWEDCRLIRLRDGWTLLQIGEETVCIGTDPDEPCPYPDGWQIYVGCAPAAPNGPYTVVCNDTWLRHHSDSLTERCTNLLYDQPITFTPQRGEWRTTLWL